MTKPQQEAWTKATDLLKEHFDSVLLVIETECDECTDCLFDAMWHGGLTTAIGLAERAKTRLCSRSEISDKPSATESGEV